MAESSMMNRFESVPDTIIFNGLHPVEWDDKYFDAMEIYKVPKLTAGDITKIFKSLSDEMMTKKAGRFSHIRLLCVAMNIGKPTEEKGWSRLLDEFPEGNVDIEAGLSSIPPVISVYDIKYATFICAFILKLITKTPENVVNSWTICQNRFKGFYPNTRTKTQTVPAVEWLRGIKVSLDHDNKCVRTVLKFIQSLEKEHPDPDRNEAALLCQYLFSGPLSYAGMHAYKLFLDVKAVSGKSDQFLLNALRRPFFNSALDEIALILTKFESTTLEAKSTKFKYARLVGPQYFMALQTKKCRGLVCCLASILKYHPQSQPGSSNLENIYALRTLSTLLREKIDMIAQRIVQAMTPEAQVTTKTAQFMSGRKEIRDPFA